MASSSARRNRGARSAARSPNGNADGLPDLITGARGSIPIGGPTYRFNYDYNVTPTILFHLGLGYSHIFFFDHGPYTFNGGRLDCVAVLQLQGCEGNYHFPTVIAGNAGMGRYGTGIESTRVARISPARLINRLSMRL